MAHGPDPLPPPNQVAHGRTPTHPPPPNPVNRRTDTSENITFHPTTYVVGKKFKLTITKGKIHPVLTTLLKMIGLAVNLVH